MDSPAQRLLAIERALDELLLADAAKLRRDLGRMRARLKRGQPIGRDLRRAEQLVGRSSQARAERARAVPRPSYPAELPVSQRRADILAALRAHQVVIVCGDTGSGKTTQLPKLLLETGCGVRGLVGCTQPRRLAAVSVAGRVADELGVALGQEVGYQVRFDERRSKRTRVKFMTDGILLAETQGDRGLHQYDALIVDEAHERSLNIDFLLGYLRNLLPRRPDLRVVISSATLDAAAFAKFFDNAGVVEVAGRTHPIEDRYLPARGDDEPLGRHVVRAVELVQEEDPEGDILVFLPGEREIRDAADKLNGRRWPNTEVLPLFARLGLGEQQRVFRVGGRRRIVLATNVAETSLTIPGIRFVIDSGLARVTGFNTRTQVQSLQVRPVSQASARQRRGRCGRIGPGVCVRLYEEEDFGNRIEFTPPEIRRSSLAGVILRMKALGLPDIREFPFVDPPQKSLVRDGLRTLREIGAIDESEDLTPLGRELARFPVDPRIGRMVRAAVDENALREVMVIAAGLSVQDVRERPAERQSEADEAHAQWADPASDFVSLLKLWDALSGLSSRSAVRRFCGRNYLSSRRVFEWQNILAELSSLVIDDFGWKVAPPGETHYDAVHKAVLAGIPSHLGWRGERTEYQGARGRRFHLFPGSGLFKKPPEWIVAFSLVETTKLYARQAARIRPEWLEQVAPHLCTPSWSEPAWSEADGFVYAKEAVSCCGLRILGGRRVHYGRVRPDEARDIFIRHGLTPGALRSRGTWLRHHRALLREIEVAEQKIRRPNGLLHEEAVVAFFAERVPESVHTTRDFEDWRVQAERREPRLLCMTFEQATYDLPEAKADLPDEWRGFPLSYRCDPGGRADGITLDCRIEDLGRLPEGTGEWLVPAWLPEKVGHLLRTLPKTVRTALQPLARTVGGFVAATEPEGPLLPALCAHLRRVHGQHVKPEDFDAARLPEHLTMYFVVRDENGKPVVAGRDLDVLRAAVGREHKERFHELAPSQYCKTGASEWVFGVLPDSVAVGRGLRGWPALVDEGRSVGLTVFPGAAEANRSHRRGLARLARCAWSEPVRYAEKRLPLDPPARLRIAVLGEAPGRNVADLIDRAIIDTLGEVRDGRTFADRIELMRGELYEAVASGCARFERIARAYDAASEALESLRESGRSPEAVADIDHQILGMFPAGFLFESTDLDHLARFLDGVRVRIERAVVNPAKDAEKLARIRPFQTELDARAEEVPAAFPRLLQEFRLAVFAPEIGTKQKVSAKRLRAALEADPNASPDPAPSPPPLDTDEVADQLARAWGQG